MLMRMCDAQSMRIALTANEECLAQNAEKSLRSSMTAWQSISIVVAVPT
jgi:hypothetical protein